MSDLFLRTNELDGTGSELLAVFSLKEGLYAFDAAIVREIIRPEPATPVPHAPEAVVGVINLRGRILTIVDTAVLLGLSPSVPDNHSRILVVEDGPESIGLLVDRVVEVLERDLAFQETKPDNMTSPRAECCTGTYRAGDRIIAILDAPSLLGLFDSLSPCGASR